MMQNRKKSFRFRIKVANFLMVSCMILFLAVFNIINTNVNAKYNNAFRSYNELNLHYKNLEEINAYLKDFLYTESDTAKAKYQHYIEETMNNLEALKTNKDIPERWRFELLENMTNEYIHTCERTVDAFLKEDESYLPYYDKLTRDLYLIVNTSGSYYSLITSSMDKQKETLSLMYQTTLVGTVLLITILLLWLLYYSYQLMTSITKPIDLLLHNINSIKQGKYDLTQIANVGEEMEGLCYELQDMAKDVQKNIENTTVKANLEKQLLEQENENLRKDELLAQSELRMLQNQINPHFLFNTLNMIYRLCLRDHADDAADMLLKTSKLLRYGLDNQNRLSNLYLEIESIQNYIDIQKKRLGDRILYQVDVIDPLSFRSIAIPSMILQPLVENAIKHGLNTVDEGEINIIIKKIEDGVMISVTDNGVGMPSERLELFQINNYQIDDQKTHMGLYNVIRRLQMLYGERVRVSLNSAKDCGFEIIIQIRENIETD